MFEHACAAFPSAVHFSVALNLSGSQRWLLIVLCILIWHFIHLHTVIDILPSWFKDSHKFLQYSCQNESWILWCCLASCWVFVGLVSFPPSLAILLQHLTMTGCLTEGQCRAFCPQVLGLGSFRTDLSEGMFIFRLVVLCEHRTACFAAAVSVSVACWCATMLLHRCCTMSLQMIMGDHVSQHMKFYLGVLTFPPVFFWRSPESSTLSMVFI